MGYQEKILNIDVLMKVLSVNWSVGCFICDNRYFLNGVNKTIEDVIQKNKTNGVKNIIIISSPKTSEIFCFLQFNKINFRCSDTIFYAPPETFDFLREWICPYISRHLLSLNPLQAHCRRYSRGER